MGRWVTVRRSVEPRGDVEDDMGLAAYEELEPHHSRPQKRGLFVASAVCLKGLSLGRLTPQLEDSARSSGVRKSA